MKARGWWVVMLVMALLVVVPKSQGQSQLPQTDPPRTVVATDTVMSWDRSLMPGEIELMPAKTMLAYDRFDFSNLYGQLFLTCNSTSENTGRCPTEDTGDNSTGYSVISVPLQEQRSGSITEIAVHGAILRADPNGACSTDMWKQDTQPLHTSYASRCSFFDVAGTSAQIWIAGSEMERLVAGKWQGRLELNLRSPIDDMLGTYRFNLELTITDHNAVSIYFPQYESASPLVNLDARFDPISQTVGGRIKMEMCLYDGLGSQAAYLGVTARDKGTRTPGPTGFSLWHPAAGTDDSQRLDYTVTIEHNGAPFSMANGIEQQLTGIDSANLRPVVLPGMSQAVYCVPTPMTLEIPRVPVASKQSGTYWGDLVIELRVPTATP